MSRYRVWQDGDDEKWGSVIDTLDAEMAAEEWAERDDSDSAEYHIVGGRDITVNVRDLETDEVTRYTVSGEAVPQYTAREITEGGAA